MSLAEMEDSLLRNLFKGYQKWVRPVQHANDTITVRFGLKISQLVDVVRKQYPETSLCHFKFYLKKAHLKTRAIRDFRCLPGADVDTEKTEQNMASIF